MTDHTPIRQAAPGVALTDDPVVVELAGDLDLSTASAAELAVSAALRRSPHIVLDMRHVPFCDSAGLRVIATAVRETRTRGGSLTLRDPQPLPLTAMRISGLVSAMQIEMTDSEQLSSN
jgi:anti-sigma B factor antagonist